MSGKGTHVLLSYLWDSRDLVAGIFNRLITAGIPCWMAYNRLKDEGIDDVALVVAFCSKTYQASKKCRKEYCYADVTRCPETIRFLSF